MERLTEAPELQAYARLHAASTKIVSEAQTQLAALGLPRGVLCLRENFPEKLQVAARRLVERVMGDCLDVAVEQALTAIAPEPTDEPR